MAGSTTVYLAVAAGGALGASARFFVSTWALRLVPGAFPWGTFAVNVLGCVVFGVLAGVLERADPGPAGRTFLLAGLLGGFTTFSAFAFENVELLTAGQYGRLTLNIGGQVVLGLAGLWLGFLLSRA